MILIPLSQTVLMREANERFEKVTDSIKYLDSRMSELEADKRELVQAQALERKRKVGPTPLPTQKMLRPTHNQ